jgi:peptidoglycan/xylan/chitin deacetylase (PgdA/CDA1 family)
MRNSNGILIISLDFEQYWGVRYRTSIEAFKQKLLGERSVIPKILNLFKRYQIHATWATVGLLFFENRDELLQGLPETKPQYTNGGLSPYINLEDFLGTDEMDDPYHFAPSLIKMIASIPHQEIATHTFSHYYCLEKGQDSHAFKEDLRAAIEIANKYNLPLESLVFPKNQINNDYLPICRELGIKAYRGNPRHWIYQIDPVRRKQDKILSKIRFLNLFFNIFGCGAYPLEDVTREFPFNIRASNYYPLSRFGNEFPFDTPASTTSIRRHLKRAPIWELLRLRRIKNELTHAARRGLVYHLWWHPHDFGVDQEENLSFLENILNHYEYLRERAGMESLNMKELSTRLLY